MRKNENGPRMLNIYSTHENLMIRSAATYEDKLPYSQLV